ncbi:MAG: carbamoyltransferase HypF [Burkholderiales bacterium]|nr:carbamoyltransferase HypF [Burkholderiales bacterium]
MPTGAHSTHLKRPAPARVLASGAYLKNRACLIDGDTVHWSPVHGDLGEAANCMALERSVESLLSRASGPLQAVAHDLHPDFHSTRVALALAAQLQVPAIGVQHHHAHIGVALAEHAAANQSIGPVIGLALDGVGLGDDGSAWGGEILWVDGSAVAHRWQRLDHLLPLALPGADAAAREPWRMAAAALHALGRGDEIEPRFAPAVGALAARGVRTLLQRDLRCPRSSSAGRWFDAAAGALGSSVRQTTEAEAAMTLEARAREWLETHPDFELPRPALASLDLRPLLAELFALAGGGPQAQARGAALFHLALAGGLAHRATELARTHGTHSVVLGGGCFANQLLSERLDTALRRAGLSVFRPQAAGCGDAGLALGQAWIAACAVHAGCDARRCQTDRTGATACAIGT